MLFGCVPPLKTHYRGNRLVRMESIHCLVAYNDVTDPADVLPCYSYMYCLGDPFQGKHHFSTFQESLVRMDRIHCLVAYETICSCIMTTMGLWNLRQVDVDSISGITCLLSGTLYLVKAGYLYQETLATSGILQWYWYLEYILTTHLMVFDLCLTLDVPYKIRYMAATTMTLWFGHFIIQSRHYDIAYAVMGSMWFYPFIYSLTIELLKKNARGILISTIGIWLLLPIFLVSDPEQFIFIHGILDIITKAFFTLAMKEYQQYHVVDCRQLV